MEKAYKLALEILLAKANSEPTYVRVEDIKLICEKTLSLEAGKEDENAENGK